jgi:hypothetical protein
VVTLDAELTRRYSSLQTSQVSVLQNVPLQSHLEEMQDENPQFFLSSPSSNFTICE